MKRIQVAAGILMQGDALLLVRQVHAGRDFWSLPGGVVEEGETVLDGLRRELEEETGLVPRGPVELAHVIELRTADFVSLAHVFCVPDWRRSPAAPEGDPDGEVLAWEFTPLPLARERLRALPWPAMREPILAHLDGDPQRFYSYAATDPAADPTSASRV